MEVIKELSVSTDDIDCVVKSENRFHMNLSSFFDVLTNMTKPVYVGVTRVYMPTFRRYIQVNAYCGPVGTGMIEKDFK